MTNLRRGAGPITAPMVAAIVIGMIVTVAAVLVLLDATTTSQAERALPEDGTVPGAMLPDALWDEWMALDILKAEQPPTSERRTA